MENNEVSMFMDVKLDIGDRKKDFAPYKNWTRCLVKIQAIKCFPCYLRITFVRNVEDESETLCVRINIPGLTVRLAASRTKLYSYGIFWKQNRKRCCIFFALESQLCCDRHMKWMKKSIKNLELYRKEMLETKRASKNLLENDDTIGSTVQNSINNRKLQNILGPLPKIPDLNESNWCRRVSGMSEIYEEIAEDGIIPRRSSRTSIASGIYEEMKFPTNLEVMEDIIVPNPPPLPSRKKISKDQMSVESIPRCYTHPTTESIKKKRYLAVLESVFGRTKRSTSISCDGGKVDSAENLPSYQRKDRYCDTCTTVSYSRKDHSIFTLNKKSNKRNSFSSPDLTKYIDLSGQDSIQDYDSFSSYFYELNVSRGNSCVENLNAKECHSNSMESNPDPPVDLNISERVQPNFNISLNSSTVNLVGSNLNYMISPPSTVEEVSGYCVMAPIKRPNNETPNKNIKLEGSDQSDGDTYETMSITRNIDTNVEDAQNSSHIYQNVYMTSEDNNDDILFKENPSKSCRKNTNFDEKVSSYYHNICDAQKTRKKISCNSYNDKKNSKQFNNQNVSSNQCSQQILCEQRTINKDGTIFKKTVEEGHISEYILTVKHNIVNNSAKETNQLLPSTINTFQENQNNDNAENDSNSALYQKYATLTRLPSSKHVDKSSKKLSELSPAKKFSSLPRFKKFDFSPLKVRITNVLQKYHLDGF